MNAEPQHATFEALGTTAYVSATADLDVALAIVRTAIDEIDLACSRFRDDSDLSRVNRGAGSFVAVSPLFVQALEVARGAASRTSGLVDPTVGQALRVLGYDRTFADVARSGPAIVRAERVPGWKVIEVDAAKKSVKVPRGVALDFGATAKGLAADRAAARAAAHIGAGVLVSLGGDIAVAGEPPAEGWLVGLADDHRVAFADADDAICLWNGGLATSSTTVRRWTRGQQQLHHLIDPSTGLPAVSTWRTVSVAANSCVEANVCSAAAIVLGESAVEWLIEQGCPSRLVRGNGQVVRLNGWPEEAT